MRVLMPGALHTLGVPLAKGRDFTADDRPGAPPVALVNETLAARLWPGRDPLGRGFSVDSGGPKQSYFVVGVVRDLRGSLIRPPQPEVYVSSGQVDSRDLTIVVRSRLATAAVITAIRAAVQTEDPDLPVAGTTTVSGLAGQATAYRRFNTVLLMLFGISAATLVAAGILAVVSYSVARRTRELGVRVALGADPGRVVRLVMREMSWPTAVGIGAGLIVITNLAHLLTRQGLLFDIGERHVPTYGAAIAVVVGIVIVAAWIPARRAARIDPVVALRTE